MSIRDFSKTSKFIETPNDVSNVHLTSRYAGHTPQDNQADFGPISFLLTILGNVPIILVLKMIFSKTFGQQRIRDGGSACQFVTTTGVSCKTFILKSREILRGFTVGTLG